MQEQNTQEQNTQKQKQKVKNKDSSYLRFTIRRLIGYWIFAGLLANGYSQAYWIFACLLDIRRVIGFWLLMYNN